MNYKQPIFEMPDNPNASPVQSNLVPMVVETTNRGERAYDIYSRLLKDRAIILGTPINGAVASNIVAQLLFLEAQDGERGINVYIDSPGGGVSAGMGVCETVECVGCAGGARREGAGARGRAGGWREGV